MQVSMCAAIASRWAILKLISFAQFRLRGGAVGLRSVPMASSASHNLLMNPLKIYDYTSQQDISSFLGEHSSETLKNAARKQTATFVKAKIMWLAVCQS